MEYKIATGTNLPYLFIPNFHFMARLSLREALSPFTHTSQYCLIFNYHRKRVNLSVNSSCNNAFWTACATQFRIWGRLRRRKLKNEAAVIYFNVLIKYKLLASREGGAQRKIWHYRLPSGQNSNPGPECWCPNREWEIYPQVTYDTDMLRGIYGIKWDAKLFKNGKYGSPSNSW